MKGDVKVMKVDLWSPMNQVLLIVGLCLRVDNGVNNWDAII